VKVTKGKKPSEIRREPLDGDLRLLQIDDLRPDSVAKYMPHDRGAVVADESDVVVAWDGANAGTSAHGLNGAIGSTLARLRPIDGSIVFTPFLGHFVAANRAHLRATAKGATIPHLDPAELSRLTLDVPVIEEQERIAAILDRADAIRAKRRQILNHLETVPASIFREMFDCAKPTATVDELARKMRTGPFGSQLLHSEFVDEGIAVLGLDNVVGNEFRWAERRYISSKKYEQLKRYTVEPGDVLISIMGTTGRCVVVPSNIPTAINTKHICAITVDRQRLHPEFLRAAFLWHPDCRDYLARQTKGSIMNGLNMGIIKSMPIPAPALSLQREFADRIQHVAERRATAESASRLDDELFASLQSRAFRGEL
jgi:type I restriction enzyme, S subunit